MDSSDHVSNNTPAAAAPVSQAIQSVQLFHSTGHMAGAIAHDVNNILTGILGNLELMQRRADRLGIADFNEYLKGARSAGARGISFAQSLLAIAGHQPLEPKAIAIRQFAGNLGDVVGLGFADNVSVTVTCADDAPDVVCDDVQLEDAILQLAKQSVAEHAAKRLALSISRRALGDEAADYGLSPGVYAALSLADDGTGLSDEAALHAFEPFHPSQSAGGFTRATILGFARQSGGHAVLESHQPGDTRITILLPAVA